MSARDAERHDAVLNAALHEWLGRRPKQLMQSLWNNGQRNSVPVAEDIIHEMRQLLKAHPYRHEQSHRASDAQRQLAVRAKQEARDLMADVAAGAGKP